MAKGLIWPSPWLLPSLLQAPSPSLTTFKLQLLYFRSFNIPSSGALPLFSFLCLKCSSLPPVVHRVNLFSFFISYLNYFPLWKFLPGHVPKGQPIPGHSPSSCQLSLFVLVCVFAYLTVSLSPPRVWGFWEDTPRFSCTLMDPRT